MKPQVGQVLFASCSQEDYGRIIAVGEDPNHCPTIDIELFNVADAFDFEQEMFEVNGKAYPNYCSIEVPEGTKIILRNLQYKVKVEPDVDTEAAIECNTPGNGCYRCTKFFWLHDDVMPPI